MPRLRSRFRSSFFLVRISPTFSRCAGSSANITVDYLRPEVGKGKVRFSYAGLDGVRRFTEVAFDTMPRTLSGERAALPVESRPGRNRRLEVRITSGSEREASHGTFRPSRPVSTAHWLRDDRKSRNLRPDGPGFRRATTLFDSLLTRSQADLTSLISHTIDGTFMMAGIPWFATLFGRDSIITTLVGAALQSGCRCA